MQELFKIYIHLVIVLDAFASKCNWLEERVMFSDQN